jgi:hypothetical protein
VEHLVRFNSPEGRDAYHQAANLDEALKFVERLRNNEGVDNVRLFRLHEIPLEFRAYYRVEVRPDGVENGVPEAPAVPPADDTGGEDSPLVAVSRDGDGDVGNRRLFGRT